MRDSKGVVWSSGACIEMPPATCALPAAGHIRLISYYRADRQERGERWQAGVTGDPRQVRAAGGRSGRGLVGRRDGHRACPVDTVLLVNGRLLSIVFVYC